jgi:hypothetical protein
MIDFTLAELLTGLDMSDSISGMSDDLMKHYDVIMAPGRSHDAIAEGLRALDLCNTPGSTLEGHKSLSEWYRKHTAQTVTLRSEGRLVPNGEPLEADASFRDNLLAAGVDDPNIQTATGHALDAIGMRYGIIRDGYWYEATEVSAGEVKR